MTQSFRVASPRVTCFFAVHELGRERAFTWLCKLRVQEAVWADVSAQIQEYLREQYAPGIHIADQIERAKRMLGPWLYAVEE